MHSEDASPRLSTADEQLTLPQAAAIARIPLSMLIEHAEAGRLRGDYLDDGWHTTRRWLHVYLLNDLGEHRSWPLPAGYVAPPGEPRRKLRAYTLPVTSVHPLSTDQGTYAVMKTVVVVEDDENIRAVIDFTLKQEGYRVLWCDDEATLRIALDEQPDLILLDVHLPHLDSVEVSRWLRTGGFTAHIPIVGMTAAPDSIARSELIADQWLTKPFHLDHLIRIVAYWTTGPANQLLSGD